MIDIVGQPMQFGAAANTMPIHPDDIFKNLPYLETDNSNGQMSPAFTQNFYMSPQDGQTSVRNSNELNSSKDTVFINKAMLLSINQNNPEFKVQCSSNPYISHFDSNERISEP